MKLDLEANDYIKQKEPTMGVTNQEHPYIGFTYPKTKQQLQDEFQKLLMQNKKAKMPLNYINCYLTIKNNKLTIINEYDEEYQQQNFRYKLTPKDQTITPKTIKKIIQKKYEEQPIQETYKKIKQEIKKYVYLTNEAEYDIITIYILMTYKYLHFDFIPIIHLNGEAGTGKSQISKIATKLGFNPSITVSTTKSSFFRRIDRKRGLYCIDEKEKLEEHEKELLNGCTYEGNVHTVTEKQGDNLIDTDFQIYTPVILACINDVYGATSTRMIKIETTRPPRKNKKYEVLKISEDKQEWRDIRDQLIIWSIITYKENKKLLQIEQEYEELLNNRGVDSWKIILNLSKQLGSYNTIKDYIKNYYLDQIEELQETDINLNFLIYLYKLGERDDWIPGKDLYIEFTNYITEKQREYFNLTRFGKILRKIGLSIGNNNKKRTSEGIKYKINHEMIRKYIENNYEINLELIREEKIF